MSDLIVVKQLPIIEEKLKALKLQIQKEVDEVKALVCTAETKKIVKEKRAELNKKFKELETKRKEVKSLLLDPYDVFVQTYDDCVTSVFKPALVVIDSKISTIEDVEKREKETEVKSYFEELRTSLNIDFVEFGQAGLKIGLSNTVTSLKKEADQFLNKVKEDIDLIETQENKAEILVEYKKTLNVSQSIVVVSERIQRIAEEKEKQAERDRLKEERRIAAEKVENVIEIQTPVQIVQAPIQTIEVAKEPKEKIISSKFIVRATMSKLIELKIFLEKGGYDFE